MSPHLITDPLSTPTEGFDPHLLSKLQEAPCLAISLPLQNRPWALLGQLALHQAGQGEGLILVIAPHAAAFADAAHTLDALSQRHGLNWVNLASDIPPPALARVRERIAGGQLRLALIDGNTLRVGSAQFGLDSAPIAHLALWQAHQLPVPDIARWWRQATRAETFSASLWLPALPLTEFTRIAHGLCESLTLEPPAWSVLPPTFERAEVTVVRKVNERLKCNKLLRLLHREGGPRQPAQIVVVRQPAQVEPLAHWLSDRLRRPVSALTPERSYRQQVSLLNQLRYSSGQLIVLPESLVDAVTVTTDRPLRWIVWEPLTSLDVLASIAFTGSGVGHVPTECLIFHTRDDILTRRDTLKRQNYDHPGTTTTALSELTRWHRWVLSNECRRSSLMQRYGERGAQTLPLWLPQWDEHPPQPCGDCDRCHAPGKSLLSRLQPWFNRLIY